MTMADTDWRPSPCPICGKMRHASAKPVCESCGSGLTASSGITHSLEHFAGVHAEMALALEKRAPVKLESLSRWADELERAALALREFNRIALEVRPASARKPNGQTGD